MGSSLLPHLPVTDEKAATENFEAIGRWLIVGTGSPQGRVPAQVGAMYTREDGGKGSTLYVKESAASPSDPFGWTAK